MINIAKSQPAPDCLELEKSKKNGDYGCGEVRDRLQVDFFNKCYICEEKAPSSIVIEHFIAHGGDVDLKFDWNNLFFACTHCNNVKHSYFNDIFNCTDFTEIITDCIQFHFDPFPEEKISLVGEKQISKAQKTIELLEKVYNGKTTNQVMEADNIRIKLRTEISNFLDAIEDYQYSRQERYQVKIKQMLSPESAFTAFKIWIIKKNPDLITEFGDLLPHF